MLNRLASAFRSASARLRAFPSLSLSGSTSGSSKIVRLRIGLPSSRATLLSSSLTFTLSSTLTQEPSLNNQVDLTSHLGNLGVAVRNVFGLCPTIKYLAFGCETQPGLLSFSLGISIGGTSLMAAEISGSGCSTTGSRSSAAPAKASAGPIGRQFSENPRTKLVVRENLRLPP